MYLLFAGDNYYPGTPSMDFIGKYDTKDEAILDGDNEREADWYDVYDVNGDSWIVVNLNMQRSEQ